MKRKRAKIISVSLLLILLSGILIYEFDRPLVREIHFWLRGWETVGQTMRKLTPKVKERLEPYLEEAGMEFPPKRVSFIVFKKEKKLELWGDRKGEWRYIRTYDVLGASGKAGPKLKRGDRQVPEGIYRITLLNPNGYNYLTMLLDYPNEFDRRNAEKDNRANLGGDICIHGKACSIGCVAMGDVVIEELFILVTLAGMDNVKVIIAPNDLRKDEPVDEGQMGIPWIKDLYQTIRGELKGYPKKLVKINSKGEESLHEPPQ